MHGLAVIHQRRRICCTVIWIGDAQSTYLLNFPTWQRAKPGTLPRHCMVAAICFHLFIYFSCHGKGLSQEPSPGKLVQSGLYLFPTGEIARLFLFIGTIDSSCYSIDRQFLYTVRTAHSGLSMGTEHQLLILFFHWTLDGLVLMFWCRCHDRCIPHQNSQSCFNSSVLLMSSRQDDMSPVREPFGKELILQPTLNLHFYS